MPKSIQNMVWPAAVAIMSVAATLPAQQKSSGGAPPTMLESYQQARTLLDAAVTAHGGIDALRAARKIRVVQEGFDFHPTQGRRVAAPFDSTVRRQDMMIDVDKGRIVNESIRGYPGGFYYNPRFVSNGDKHYFIEPRYRYYSAQEYPPANQQFGNLFAAPQWYLLAAYESSSPGARRYLGKLRVGRQGAIVEAIHFTIPPSGNIVIGIDPQTRRLRTVMSVATDVFAGDTEAITEFHDWKMFGGTLMPSRVTLTRGGNVTSAMRTVSVTPGFEIPDSLLAPPVTFSPTPTGAPSAPVNELSPGIWAVGGGSKSLVVSFNDHLVVVDAPSGGSADVIRRAATMAPGKPIRFVVPTHHHDDHFFGVRHHVANGSTIVTTPGNIEYLRRMMNAPISSVMLAANQAPPSARYNVETITGDKRVFTDGSRTLEIHRINSPHAEEMLIAWLPAEGILFHADLIEAPYAGVALNGANAETTVHLANIIREKGWNVRTFVGAHGPVQSAALFDDLVKLPIIPPG